MGSAQLLVDLMRNYPARPKVWDKPPANPIFRHEDAIWALVQIVVSQQDEIAELRRQITRMEG